MKKIAFDIVFKVVILLLLSTILLFCYNISESNSNNYNYHNLEPSEIGRYKEFQDGKILDTKTGDVFYARPR
jgi:hypothetical protein